MTRRLGNCKLQIMKHTSCRSCENIKAYCGDSCIRINTTKVMTATASGTENIKGHRSGVDIDTPINCVNKLPAI